MRLGGGGGGGAREGRADEGRGKEGGGGGLFITGVVSVNLSVTPKERVFL